jgi:hypothetical protein
VCGRSSAADSGISEGHGLSRWMYFGAVIMAKTEQSFKAGVPTAHICRSCLYSSWTLLAGITR